MPQEPWQSWNPTQKIFAEYISWRLQSLCSFQAVANGDSSAALSVASIFAQTFTEATVESPVCDPDSASARAREDILNTMLRLDSVTYSSSTFILQVRPFSTLHSSMGLKVQRGNLAAGGCMPRTCITTSHLCTVGLRIGTSFSSSLNTRSTVKKKKFSHLSWDLAKSCATSSASYLAMERF